MRSAIISLFALVAASLVAAERYSPEHLGVKRQAVQSGVPVYESAMTDANGNVISFDPNNVYLSGQADGL